MFEEILQIPPFSLDKREKARYWAFQYEVYDYSVAEVGSSAV